MSKKTMCMDSTASKMFESSHINLLTNSNASSSCPLAYIKMENISHLIPDFSQQ